MATNNLAFDNFFSTTLSSTITASDTTVYLNALPAASEGYLVIEPDSSTNREIIYYTSKGANFVTCPSAASGRGIGGTTAVSHNSGSTVQMNTVAEMFEDIQGGTSNTGMHQYFDDSFADYIKSGGAITQATGLIASVTSGVSYINGRRLTFNAFSKTLTASKDTYFDLYETDGSNIATISYTELSSGATGSTPVSNGVHLGMVRSNASVLATIYQSSYDTLGNPLKLTTPLDTLTQTRVLGYAQSTSTFSASPGAGTYADVTSLSVTVNVPAGGANIEIEAFSPSIQSSAVAAQTLTWAIREGSTDLNKQVIQLSTANYNFLGYCKAYIANATYGTHTYKVSMQVSSANTVQTANVSATSPAFILVKAL